MTYLNREQLANLAVLLILMAITGWYLWDTWRASTQLYNLVFVLPLTVTILVLCAFVFIRDLLNPPGGSATHTDGVSPLVVADGADRVQDQGEVDDEAGSLSVILLFIGYVVTLPWLGFDVGTFLFVAVFLKLAGEQKWQWILGYSLAFASAAALFFSAMLPYAMPLLLLPGVD